MANFIFGARDIHINDAAQFHEDSNPTTGLHDNIAATNHLATYCGYGDMSSLCREKALDGEDT
jgi:hypothetical protein